MQNGETIWPSMEISFRFTAWETTPVSFTMVKTTSFSPLRFMQKVQFCWHDALINVHDILVKPSLRLALNHLCAPRLDHWHVAKITNQHGVALGAELMTEPAYRYMRSRCMLISFPRSNVRAHRWFSGPVAHTIFIPHIDRLLVFVSAQTHRPIYGGPRSSLSTLSGPWAPAHLAHKRTIMRRKFHQERKLRLSRERERLQPVLKRLGGSFADSVFNTL